MRTERSAERGRRAGRSRGRGGQATTPARQPAQKPVSLGRLDLVLLSLLFALSLTLFVYHLGVPSWYEYDEVYHSFTAAQYLLGNPEAFVWYIQPPQQSVQYMWSPPLGLWLIAGG